MNDPWDVKSVRQSGQYVSCMKINGVPLLPPLLSKECREEMKYYKLLAQEVQKRMSVLQPHIYELGSSSSDYEDSTEAPELPECEEETRTASPECKVTCASPTNANETILNCTKKNLNTPIDNTPQYFIDLNVNINNRESLICKTVHRGSTQIRSPTRRDVPERDYNCFNQVSQCVVTEKQIVTKTNTIKKKSKHGKDVSASMDDPMTDPFSEIPMPQDGPPSISCKSFTGSLNDLYSDSIKDSQIQSGKLLRQSSYTLLKPSPELLAHLEVHSQTTGLDMASISMTDSHSSLCTPNKKRRSWDLQSAKEKWSNMALELKQKDVINVTNKCTIKQAPKKVTPLQSKPFVPSPIKHNNTVAKQLPKSEPIPKSVISCNPVKNHITDRKLKSEPPSPPANNNKTCDRPMDVITIQSEDPAMRIQELYEKVQQQQLTQMANLVEKQKREQMLLQQVFEEQNNLLFKQLKMICPKSPIEVKEAWGDQHCESDSSPVSLSQVINYKSPIKSNVGSPVSSTLTDTNMYINHCDNVLKKSRTITGSLKKQPIKSYNQNGNNNTARSPQRAPDSNRTRNNSPVLKNKSTPRRLNYDTSASTDRDNDQILTDRTNDTMADLNVTFPSDHSDNGNTSVVQNKSIAKQYCGKQIKTNHRYSPNAMLHSGSTDNDSKKTNRPPVNSAINSVVRTQKTPVRKPPTPKQHAAATKIVAHVKGYLVRRLMRTDRVQGIVQTIKDALLCALQLHQDREGIRGADVDLHRRLIQQITAACYTLHDTFVASSPTDRCAMIAADRDKKKRANSILNRSYNNSSSKHTDIMSQSYCGSFPARAKRQPPSLMTQSNYETFSGDKGSPVSRRYMASPRRRPWR